MKETIRLICKHLKFNRCTYAGFVIDDCKPIGCKLKKFTQIPIKVDPDYEPFIDELNRRLSKGV